MRLDQFLKLTRILKQRTVAKQACDAGWVTVNGEVAKPGTVVHAGDRLSIDMPVFRIEAEVLEVPRNSNVPRKQIDLYVKILSRQSRDPHNYVFGDDAVGDDDADAAEDSPLRDSPQD
jgi:ribosomal 50S subunit-recycling heat shock protein